jgi:biotin operon repressor
MTKMREIEMLSEAEIQTHAERIRNDGYTVVERAADPTWSRD